MQGIDNVLGVVFDDIGVGENRDPVVLATLGGLDTVHAETPRQTSNTTKDGFESLSQVMRNEVPALQLATTSQRSPQPERRHTRKPES